MSRLPLEIPPGLNADDTTFASSPAWADGSNMRFRLGRPETIGGWESISLSLLTGVCRTAYPWTDNTNLQHIAFGTHSALWVWKSGDLANITPSSGFTAGQIDGTGSAGYGTGAYGAGNYGQPSATDYFPLTWSLDAWGQKLLASPRNQTIFEWSNNTAVVAAAVTNAPSQVTYMLVAPTRQVFALGCSQEVGGTFNPNCIRHSGIADNTSWSTTSSSASTSREYVLSGGGRIVGGRMVGRQMLVWRNHDLWMGTYYGQITKVWSFDRVGRNCGLIGPNAAIVVGNYAYWLSPDRQFYRYSPGGSVEVVPCPIREDLSANLAASQGDKVVASSISEYGEIRFDYPDRRDGYENSRYVALTVEGPDAGSWYRGIMARTAMVDAGPTSYPCGVTYGGNIYWHEKGRSADGAAFDWFIETADMYMDEERMFLTRGIWPDFANQVGPAYLTITTRKYPQTEEGDTDPPVTFGPYTMAPGDDRVDFKATGRLARVRFYGSSAPTRLRIGRPTFDVKLRGRQ